MAPGAVVEELLVRTLESGGVVSFQISGESMTPALRHAISENRSSSELAKILDDDFITMRGDGLQKAAAGKTTIEEVLRTTQDADESGV